MDILNNSFTTCGARAKLGIILIISALLLGCAAPGVGIWFTAWFCLAPLLIFIRTENSLIKIWLYAFLFGLVFNCVYLQWYLGLTPLDWLGFNAWQGNLLAMAAVLINASHQALLIAIFGLVYRLFLNLLEKISANSSRRQTSIANLFEIFLVPLLWVIITNKFGNAHNLTGVPWSMLEYTQYKQLPLIQIADIIGGIGICYLIVLTNMVIAQIFCTVFSLKQNNKLFIHQRFKSNNINFALAIHSHLPAISLSALLLIGILAYGHYKLSFAETAPNNNVSIVQPNINIEMEKSKKQYSIEEVLAYQLSLSNNCPPGLCVWTESALPVRLCSHPEIQAVLKNFAIKKNISLVIGTIDKDLDNNFYNAAWGISANGKISGHIYHKRYLVPFGEYTPAFVRDWPDWILSLTNTPAGCGYSSGQAPDLLDIDDKLIAPLICFEVISPELAAASVRDGAQLLVNINDLAWFHQSIIGKQMIACAVLRAVENRRDVIFAANTGPSATISSLGQIKSYIGQNKATNLISKVNFSSKLSTFTRWFVF